MTLKAGSAMMLSRDKTNGCMHAEASHASCMPQQSGQAGAPEDVWRGGRCVRLARLHAVPLPALVEGVVEVAIGAMHVLVPAAVQQVVCDSQENTGQAGREGSEKVANEQE